MDSSSNFKALARRASYSSPCSDRNFKRRQERCLGTGCAGKWIPSLPEAPVAKLSLFRQSPSFCRVTQATEAVQARGSKRWRR